MNCDSRLVSFFGGDWMLLSAVPIWLQISCRFMHQLRLFYDYRTQSMHHPQQLFYYSLSPRNSTSPYHFRSLSPNKSFSNKQRTWKGSQLFVIQKCRLLRIEVISVPESALCQKMRSCSWFQERGPIVPASQKLSVGPPELFFEDPDNYWSH